jgi:putative peptidoglycan lipid II flippase
LDQGIDQINGVVEVNRAQNLGTGPISHYNYASTLHLVPIMLLGNAIATAAFPRLTDRLAQGRPDLFRRDFLNILRVMIWLTAPVVVIAFFCRGYLARLIVADTNSEVAVLLGFLSVAIFARVVYAMVSRYFYAHKDTRTPLFVSLFAIGLNILLTFQLVRAETYGASGLAIAQSIVAVSEVGLLFAIMIKRDPKLIDRHFWSGVAQIASITGFSIMVGYLMINLLPLQSADRGLVTLGSKFALISGAVLLTHTLVSWLFDLEEGRTVIRKARQFILRPVRVQ